MLKILRERGALVEFQWLVSNNCAVRHDARPKLSARQTKISEFCVAGWSQHGFKLASNDILCKLLEETRGNVKKVNLRVDSMYPFGGVGLFWSRVFEIFVMGGQFERRPYGDTVQVCLLGPTSRY